MARNENEDMLMEDELAAAFLDDNAVSESEEIDVAAPESSAAPSDDGWEDNTDDFPGQLAVDVYEVFFPVAKMSTPLAGTSKSATGVNSPAPSLSRFKSRKTKTVLKLS